MTIKLINYQMLFVDTISPNQSQATFKSIVVDRVAGVLRHQNKYEPFFA
jgi:hypothetical protein